MPREAEAAPGPARSRTRECPLVRVSRGGLPTSTPLISLGTSHLLWMTYTVLGSVSVAEAGKGCVDPSPEAVR